MAHRQLHGLADTNNHSGITIATGNLFAADASGLPADAGVAAAGLVAKDVNGNVTITGNLTVQGQSFVADHKITTGDTLILVNNGETGAGVTNGKAGLDIDRGTDMPYRFVFNDDTDDFRIGEYYTTITLGTGEGNAFTVGEKVTGVLLTATSVAYVVAKTADTLTLRGVSSAFVADMVLTGATSAATGTQVGAQVITDSTQAVATRQDTPTDTGVAFWNATAVRFDTAAGLVYTVAAGLSVDNVNILANTISTKDTNGNLILAPNGAGQVTCTGNVYLGTTATDVASKQIIFRSHNSMVAERLMRIGTSEYGDMEIYGTDGGSETLLFKLNQGGSFEAIQSIAAPYVSATTFDTNVTAAGVTLSGTTLSADGTDDNISITLTPKGTGSVVMTKVDIDGGTIDGADITVGASKTLNVSAGTLTLADNQISGDKVEGGTINAITITTLTSTTVNATTFDTNVAAAGVTLSGTTLAADGTDDNISITLTPKGTGALSTGAELKMKLVESASQPTLDNDGGMVVWEDTDDSSAIYLLFRRGNGDQVSVELT